VAWPRSTVNLNRSLNYGRCVLRLKSDEEVPGFILQGEILVHSPPGINPQSSDLRKHIARKPTGARLRILNAIQILEQPYHFGCTIHSFEIDRWPICGSKPNLLGVCLRTVRQMVCSRSMHA